MMLFKHTLIQKTRLSLASKVCLSVVNSKTFLEYFLSFIYHKEGDCHDDINDEESYYSWNPRLKHIKTIAKQGRTKGGKDIASSLSQSR